LLQVNKIYAHIEVLQRRNKTWWRFHDFFCRNLRSAL